MAAGHLGESIKKLCVCVCVVVSVVRGIVVYLYYKVERCLSVSLSVRLFVCTEGSN